MTKDPYKIVKHLHVTEKAQMLSSLKDAQSNPSLKKCTTPKYVFIVDPTANKREIAAAVEEIYSAQKVKVTAVNTINVKSKRRRVRGREGMTKSFKKAVVSLEQGDSIDNL